MIKISYQISPSYIDRLTLLPRLVCYRGRSYDINEHDKLSTFCVQNRIYYYVVSWSKAEFETANPYFELVTEGGRQWLRKKLQIGGVKAWARDILNIEPEISGTFRKLGKRNKLYEVHDRQIDRLVKFYDGTKVRSLLENATMKFGIKLRDRKYAALPKVTLESLLKKCSFESYLWSSETRDCDNYAEYLASLISMKYNINTLGKVFSYSGTHAFNVGLCYDSNAKPFLVYVEPQTQKFVKIGESFSNSEGYDLGVGDISWG